MRALRVLLLRLVLAVPVLHRTVSRRFLLLTALDGAPVSPAVPVRYAPHDGYLIVLGSDRADWWRYLPADGSVSAEVWIKGRRLTMTASLTADEALDEAVLRYLQKYPGEWRALGIDPSAGADDVQTAARSTAVVILQ